MPDATKATLIAHHQANPLLAAAFLSPAPRHERDLAAEGPSAVLAERVRSATVEALRGGQTHYVDVPGIPKLREAFTSFVSAAGAVGYEAASMVVTASVQESRFLALQIIGEAFDAIAIPEVVHPGAAKAAGVRPKRVERIAVDAAHGFLPTVEGIRRVLAAGARVVYLESPVRLTGATLGRDTLAAIARLLVEHDAHAIVDQGAAPFVPGGAPTLGAEAGMAERATLIGDAFPGVGLERFSIGYLATSPRWFPGVTKIKQVMAICTSTPSQFAALEVSTSYSAEQPARTADLAAAKERAARASGAAAIPGEAAHVLALRPSGPSAARRALAAARIDVADGADFGAPGVLRFAVTTSDTLTAALGALS
jgi:aminotransferase